MDGVFGIPAQVKVTSRIAASLSCFLLLFCIGLSAQNGSASDQQGVPAGSTTGTGTVAAQNGSAQVVAPQIYSRPRVHIIRLNEAGTGPATAPVIVADPHATYFGGPVLANVHIVQVIYGSGSFVPNLLGTATPTVAQYYTDLVQSPLLDMLFEYSTAGVTANDGTAGTGQTIAHGSFDGVFTITPSAANNGSTITDAQIQNELLAQVTAGNLPAPAIDAQGNNNTLYMIYFPAGKTINDGTSNSCVRGGFCAYHNSTTGTFSSHRVFYGVFPDVQPPSLCALGCGGLTPMDTMTNVASHEFSEAVTDADVGPANVLGRPLAWIDPVNSEIGDICVGLGGTTTVNANTYIVQQEFSNFENTCSAAPPSFVLSNFTPTETLGSAFNLTVALQTGASGFGGTYTGTVHFTSSDPKSVMPSDYQYNLADNAIHPFLFTLNTAGNQTITATDPQRPGVTGRQNIQVNAPAAARFQIASPATAQVGVAISLRISAVDNNFVLVPSYSGTLHFTSTDAAAVLPPDAALVNGKGTFSVTLNTPGVQFLTISDGTGITGQVTPEVFSSGASSTTTAFSVSPTSITFGQSVTLSVAVTGGTGAFLNTPVQFTVDGGQVASANVDSTGHAQTTAIIRGGIHTMFAEFLGDSFHTSSSSSPLTLTVNPAPTTLTVSSSANPTTFGQSAAFSIAMSSPAGGAIPGFQPVGGVITVFDGTTPIFVLPQLQPGGSEGFSTQSLTSGSHSITASFSGNPSFAASTSAALSQVVNPSSQPDYSISPDRTSATVLAGQSASFSLTLRSLNFFNGTVAFSCGNLPAFTACDITRQNTVLEPNTVNAIATITIRTTGPHTGTAQFIHPYHGFGWYALAGPFAFVLVLARGRRRKLLLSSAMLVVSFALISCGGGSTPIPQPTPTPVPQLTPAGTSTVTIAAVGAAISGTGPANPKQQLNITLTVQP